MCKCTMLQVRACLLSLAVVVVLLSRPALAQTVQAGTRAQNGPAVVSSNGFDGRIAAGTSWEPDSTPSRAYHAGFGSWRLMLHGSASVGFVREPTPRGGARLAGFNWFGGHLRRPAAGGVVTISTMGSLETVTLGACGSPRLLFAGPTCAADVVGDYQHAHAPIMELAARYDWPLGQRTAVQVYAGLAGDPALGPTFYLHRLAAAADPVSPITSHEMNVAHASGLILTTGVVSGIWKIEGSVFGRGVANPDRLVPPLETPRSLAARLSVNPGRNWSLQASMGRIAADPGHHGVGGAWVATYTASASYHRYVEGVSWAATAAWAYSRDDFGGRGAALIESSFATGRHTFFTRGEAAKRLEARVHMINHPDGTHEMWSETVRHRLGQISAGYLFDARMAPASIGVGVRGSVTFVPSGLEPLYLQRRPIGFAVFASIRPPFTSPDEHHAH